MKKKYLLILSLFLPIVTYAAPSCTGLFSNESWEWINQLFDLIRLVAPVALILLMAFDVLSAVISDGDDGIIAALKRSKNRIIATVLVFIVPTLVKLILNLEPIKIGLNLVDDPTCGLADSV